MKEKISAFFLISFFVTFGIMIILGYYKRNEIDTYGKVTVGKYVARERNGKYPNDYFIYFINGQKYRSSGGSSSPEFHKNIENFYRLKYLEKEPEVIHALYDQQVTDTIEMLNAGFTMEEILKRNNPAIDYW